MFVCGRLELNILVFILFAEGLLLNIVACSSKTNNTDVQDAEENQPTIPEGEMKPNTSETGSVNFMSNAYYIPREFHHNCEKCGVSNRGYAQLILGGDIVKPQFKYPWIVALQRNGETFCGGSLLDEYFILTAAHCLVNPVLEGEYVHPKEIDVAFLKGDGYLKTGPPLAKIIPHPGFSMTEPDHDIALLKLSRKIICDKFTRPICLPSFYHEVEHGDEFITIGWGTFKYGHKVMSKVLLEATIKSVPFHYCEKYFPKRMAKHFYCLHGANHYQSPCNGDSGGPMFHEKKGISFLFGVTSIHGHEKCHPEDNFLYTSVPVHIPWIKEMMDYYT